MSASLPLALCNLALLVAAVACWEPSWHLAVELTYFWGLAGAMQAVVTPDLGAGFPQLEFFEFVVGHLGVVIAALYLVVGLRLRPRPGSVKRVFAVTAAYTAFVGWFDWLTGSNYMFLAAVPATGSLLVGPRPVALVHRQRGRRRTRPVLGPRCAVPSRSSRRWPPGRVGPARAPPRHLAAGTARDLVGPQLAVNPDRRGGLFTGTLGRGAVSVGEGRASSPRTRTQPRSATA